jgi:hypothetical protein
VFNPSLATTYVKFKFVMAMDRIGISLPLISEIDLIDIEKLALPYLPKYICKRLIRRLEIERGIEKREEREERERRKRRDERGERGEREEKEER